MNFEKSLNKISSKISWIESSTKLNQLNIKCVKIFRLPKSYTEDGPSETGVGRSFLLINCSAGRSLQLTYYSAGRSRRLTNYSTGRSLRLTYNLAGPSRRLTNYWAGRSRRLTYNLAGRSRRLTNYLAGRSRRIATFFKNLFNLDDFKKCHPNVLHIFHYKGENH